MCLIIYTRIKHLQNILLNFMIRILLVSHPNKTHKGWKDLFLFLIWIRFYNNQINIFNYSVHTRLKMYHFLLSFLIRILSESNMYQTNHSQLLLLSLLGLFFEYVWNIAKSFTFFYPPLTWYVSFVLDLNWTL